jgi:hypothetical protein
MNNQTLQVKTFALARVDAQALMLGLTAVAALAPLLRVQLLAGTVVNAALVVALLTLGKKQAMAVALFPSTIAVMTGILPLAMLPIIPLIVAGNVILIHVFGELAGRGFIKAAVAASLAKFVFLAMAGNLFLGLTVSPAIGRGFVSIISYTQLATALMGCFAAYLVLKFIALGKKHD